MIINAEHVFVQKKKLDKMKKRKLPKGRSKWQMEDELEIQIQARVLSSMVEELNAGVAKGSPP